ncbi:MAG: hypothetical protein ACI920_003855, partial [Saprospiraceae bacterium]
GSEEWEIKIPDFWSDKSNKPKANLDIANLVLCSFYNLNPDLITSQIITFRNKKTGLQKFYRIKVIQDFIDAKSLKPIKQLTDSQLHDLLNDYENEALWEQLLPPENFTFEGIVIGYLMDVTKAEILSNIKQILTVDIKKADHVKDLDLIENRTQSYMDMPELRLGMVHTSFSFWQESTSWGLLRTFEKEVIIPSFKDEKGSYGKVLKSHKSIIVTDLLKQVHLSLIEEELVEMGIRSLFLAPLFNTKNQVVGIVEVASTLPFAFNRLSVLRMKQLIELFAMGTNKFIDELDSKEQLTMQQEFTSIHSSVEWRFKEVASKLYWQRAIEGKQVEIETIVFKDLYPLYAQADIVGSSTLRNEAIQADLLENLSLILKLMEDCRKKIDFNLLDVYIHQAKRCREHLSAGHYISSDESRITELIAKEIHPLLSELKNRFPQLPQRKIDGYFKMISPGLNIIYHHRKAYDESVSQLNQIIGDFLEKEDEKMQKILPHHFEKYTTDGVEYNIYLGDSILKNGGFSPFFLKDFRLWQLILMCKMTRLIAEKGSQLSMPLTTAQLIFVYTNTLSIRFKMEEKQFDVDGTYNVRYEILKKRIDKACIKGTGERLTVSEKVAIVYLQEKDRHEYLLYLEHLQSEGYVEGEIEDLELEKLQGAEGLKALRFQVRM